MNPMPAPQALGGLSAGAMRRVRKYVDVHLNESIDLTILAKSPGLSSHHLLDNLGNPLALPRITTSLKSG